MLKRLAIISCCALSGFAFGRWLSPPADAKAPTPSTQRQTTNSAGTDTVELPQPERAGRVPFTDLYRALRSSSTEDQAAYLSSLQKLPRGPERRAALTAFFQGMANIDPQGAADLVRQVDKDDIQRAVTAVMAATATPSTPVLVKMLLDLPAYVDSEWRTEQIRGQMFFWAALDPAAAAQFADQYKSTDPEVAAYGIIECLAAADPAAAARWLEEHPDLSKKPGVMTDYVAGLYQHDPTEARRYLTEHATEKAVQNALQAVAVHTFVASADDAAEFIKHLPTKEARISALNGVVDINIDLFTNKETSRTSLYAGVAEWVTKFSQDEWPTIMPEFLDQWRRGDPEGSMSWMAQLPGPTRSAVAYEFIRNRPDYEVKEVLVTAAGDFRTDILAAFAKRITGSPEQRRAMIEALELSSEDAAQLDALGGSQ